MQIYKDLVKNILETGHYHTDRTGVGTKRLFVKTARFDLQQGFPIVTLKKTYFLGCLREMLAFLQGASYLKDLHTSIFKWWSPFSSPSGFLGRGFYGNSLRRFGSEPLSSKSGFDQLSSFIDMIKADKDSRRLILTSYNPEMSASDVKSEFNYLVPCHMNFVQVQVVDGRLNLVVTCRSQDVFLGTPVNWVEHALFAHILANICDLDVGEYVWIGNDVHIYSNHFDQCRELLTREPLQLPRLVIKRKLTDVDDLREEDFELVDYQYHPPITAEMAV
jgi:thymidylate synthase